MKIKTTLSTIIIIGATSFMIGCQYGYYRTKEKIDNEFDKLTKDLMMMYRSEKKTQE